MNIIESIKSFIPALALMALCSAAILYLPQWNRDTGSASNAVGVEQQKPTPPAQEEGDKQA